MFFMVFVRNFSLILMATATAFAGAPVRISGQQHIGKHGREAGQFRVEMGVEQEILIGFSGKAKILGYTEDPRGNVLIVGHVDGALFWDDQFFLSDDADLFYLALDKHNLSYHLEIIRRKGGDQAVRTEALGDGFRIAALSGNRNVLFTLDEQGGLIEEETTSGEYSILDDEDEENVEDPEG
jgi:WD40 repeat protein